MGKKFQTAVAQSADVIDTITRARTKNTENTQTTADIISIQDTIDTHDTKSSKDTKKEPKQEYYRFNLKMPLEYKDYLQAAAYKASSPSKIVTITEYICELIKADMEKHKDD